MLICPNMGSTGRSTSTYFSKISIGRSSQRGSIMRSSEDKKLLSECIVQAFKASGSGGQHVQKTDSAIRLIHVPTGIRVTSQAERSQYLNKKICLEKLKKKLVERGKKRKKRVLTKKPRVVREKELQEKKRVSEKKKLRGSIKPEE